MEVLEAIKQQVTENPVIIYMKGSPQFPMCGFSGRAVEILKQCGEEFAYVDVLSNPEIRSNMVNYSDWPTFPQLFVNGELVGGGDIIAELFEKGELQQLVKQAAANE
jgi:monothiol glutaredoxin